MNKYFFINKVLIIFLVWKIFCIGPICKVFSSSMLQKLSVSAFLPFKTNHTFFSYQRKTLISAFSWLFARIASAVSHFRNLKKDIFDPLKTLHKYIDYLAMYATLLGTVDTVQNFTYRFLPTSKTVCEKS